MTFWTPKWNHHSMSTSGSIVLWFFFWWILLPVYCFIGLTWVATVVSVNAVIITYIAARWSLLTAFKGTRWSLVKSRPALARAVAQLHR